MDKMTMVVVVVVFMFMVGVFQEPVVENGCRNGQDILGAQVGSIDSIAMNKDGTVIATGEPNDSGNTTYGGSARVWVYNGTDTLIQVGENIRGQTSSDYSGYSVSLNDDGTRIAIGADDNDDNGNSSGHIRVWEYSNSDMSSGGNWTQIGQNIVGIVKHP